MRKIKGSPQPFGVDIKDRSVNFAVQAEQGKSCELLLYRKGKEEPEYRFDMPEEEGVGEVRFLAIQDLKADRYEYNFLIDGKVRVDPYVKELAGKEKFGVKRELQEHQIRGKIVSMDYDWQDDRRLHIPWEEVVAYSLHVRGFTRHSSSKVMHKGTFQGIIEKLDYLKDLGINQIQCMPVYEFEECGRTKINYWGYGEGFYFAPKTSYAAGKSAVRELKDMVRACHGKGIEVVLEMPFAQGVSAVYALECLRFYMLEYHIDGFVLNPYNVPWEQLKNDPFLKDIKLMQKDDGFQNVMRRFLKGDENMVNDVIWALKNRASESGRCNYITTHTGFTLWDLVSYDCKHNEENGENNLDGPDYNYSWNCGAEGPSRKRAIINLRKNQVKNALELLLTAQGTPCLLAGDEFCNSQRGNNNAYCQDNETGWVNWTQLKKDDWLFQYTKNLIKFRKEHHCLHQSSALSGIDRTRCGIPDVSYHGENAWQVKAEVSSRQLGVLYSGTKDGEEPCFTAYNMHWLPHRFALPSIGKNMEWYLVMNTKDGVFRAPQKLEDQKEVLLEERSVAILTGHKTAEKKKDTHRLRGKEKEQQKAKKPEEQKDTKEQHNV